jgi:hypothetical protein
VCVSLLLTPERTDPYSDQASQKAANQLDAIRGVALEVNRPLISANRWRHNVASSADRQWIGHVIGIEVRMKVVVMRQIKHRARSREVRG